MRQIFIFIFIMLVSPASYGQIQYDGRYCNPQNGCLIFDKDSTFRYEQGICLTKSWNVGKWKKQKDTIYLEVVLLYDSLKSTSLDSQTQKLGRLIKFDSTSGQANIPFGLQSSGGQNFWPCATKYVFRKNRLFVVYHNGELSEEPFRLTITKKQTLCSTTSDQPTPNMRLAARPADE